MSLDPVRRHDGGAATGESPSGPSQAAWDADEAERALGVLRRTILDTERGTFGGHFPPLVAEVMAVWVEVGEGYVRDQERLRAAGWDPLGWLRTLPTAVGETVANWQHIRDRGPGHPRGTGR